MSEKSSFEKVIDGMVDQVVDIVVKRVEEKMIEVCRTEWNRYIRIIDDSYQPLRHRVNNVEGRVKEIDDHLDGSEFREDIRSICSDMLEHELGKMLENCTIITKKGH